MRVETARSVDNFEKLEQDRRRHLWPGELCHVVSFQASMIALNAYLQRGASPRVGLYGAKQRRRSDSRP